MQFLGQRQPNNEGLNTTSRQALYAQVCMYRAPSESQKHSKPRFSKSPAQQHLKDRLLHQESVILQHVLVSSPSQSKGSHKLGSKHSQPGSSLSSFTSPHQGEHHNLTIITNSGQIFMLSTNTYHQPACSH